MTPLEKIYRYVRIKYDLVTDNRSLYGSQQVFEAKLLRNLLEVAKAGNLLDNCLIEFPEDPTCCSERIQAFQDQLLALKSIGQELGYD